jgi:hypothetical protein
LKKIPIQLDKETKQLIHCAIHFLTNNCQLNNTTIQDEFWSRQEEWLIAILCFGKIRNDIWTDDGLVLFNSRIVIPFSKRFETLRKWHSANQGIERLNVVSFNSYIGWACPATSPTRSGRAKYAKRCCPVFYASLFWDV